MRGCEDGRCYGLNDKLSYFFRPTNLLNTFIYSQNCFGILFLVLGVKSAFLYLRLVDWLKAHNKV